MRSNLGLEWISVIGIENEGANMGFEVSARAEGPKGMDLLAVSLLPFIFVSLEEAFSTHLMVAAFDHAEFENASAVLPDTSRTPAPELN
jgi:hypothetical protein